MHQRKSKKIFIYFFLLILMGSINNTEFNKFIFNKINTLNITGLNETKNKVLFDDIKKLNLKNIFFLNENEIKQVFDSNSLIESYKIFIKYPSTLNIEIEQTKFLARVSKNGKIFLVGSNGKLIKNDANKKVPYIFGKPEINEFLNFKKILDRSKFSYHQVTNFYFFPSGRWDLEISKRNVLIKLPQDYNEETFDEVFELINNTNFEKFKIVDVRVKNQIILND